MEGREGGMEEGKGRKGKERGGGGGDGGGEERGEGRREEGKERGGGEGQVQKHTHLCSIHPVVGSAFVCSQPWMLPGYHRRHFAVA